VSLASPPNSKIREQAIRELALQPMLIEHKLSAKLLQLLNTTILIFFRFEDVKSTCLKIFARRITSSVAVIAFGNSN
jgi:hypothetical protein